MTDTGVKRARKNSSCAKTEVIWTTGYVGTGITGPNVWVVKGVVEEDFQTHSYAVIKAMWQHVCDGNLSRCEFKIIVDNPDTGERVVIGCHRMFFELR